MLGEFSVHFLMFCVIVFYFGLQNELERLTKELFIKVELGSTSYSLYFIMH